MRFIDSFLTLYSAVMISASLMQKRADGEISTVPSAPIGVCSPPKPRTDRPSGYIRKRHSFF